MRQNREKLGDEMNKEIMKGEKDVTIGKELKTNFEHYQSEISKFIKTRNCSDCPAFKECNVENGDPCGSYFSKWAMSKFKPVVPEHEFKPFEQVIFRESDECEWSCGLFSHMSGNRFILTNYVGANQCIPYAGNEKLLGTTNNPE